MRTEPKPFHEKLILDNFTAFGNAELNFVPGVNAIIGENGTGKTHILKALYAVQSAARKGGVFGAREKLAGVFQTPDETDLIRKVEDPNAEAKLRGHFGGSSWFRVINQIRAGQIISKQPAPISNAHIDQEISFGEPVFIPAIDMMGHTDGFMSSYQLRELDFDETLFDIVSKLLLKPVRHLDEEQVRIISRLKEALEGEIELEKERFYLASKQGRYAMPAVAEGLRKVATLIRLVQVGMLGPGSTLFWDEPEVNLNPILMDEIVGAILALARSGVQVFLATHSYIILKELEVQASKEDALRFFALEASKSGSIVHQASKYLDLYPNKIEEQYSELYDRRIDKAMGAGLEA